ncbi:hypothetical protein ACIO1C_32720 [Streptomyces sp. NPDC087420]|uniref:hypothetical protein n=1 Tax=Streptomyces sp. NPDC087420 TaxID=3365785 RepID=UPI00383514F5
MTRTPVPTSSIAPSPRRSRLAVAGTVLAVAALAALALTACGTAKPGAGGSRGASAGPVGVRLDAPSPGPDPEMAFLRMLTTVAEPCTFDSPTGDDSIPEGDRPRSGPPGRLPVGDAPSGLPPAPTPERGTELNDVDRCERHLHEERVGRALSDLADPTPARVRRILNDLGYIDTRIHGLKRSGATTRFFVDLRFMGGRLALKGSAAGARTVVEGFGVRETGPFDPGASR